MRSQLISALISELQRRGFVVHSFLHTNSCFDIIARSAGITLALKVLANIDSLREEQAIELKKLSALFGINVLVIGERTKAFKLQDRIVYERYGVSAITLKSLCHLLDEKHLDVKYFKGKNIVEIDSEKLRKLRLQKKLSLQELAEKVGLAKENVHRLERKASTTLESAQKLEAFFKTHLIKKGMLLHAELSEHEFPYDEINDPLLRKIQNLGLEMAEFEHAPFRAVGDAEKELLIDIGKQKSEIKRKAGELSKSSNALDAEPLLVAKKFSGHKIDNIAVINEDELESMHSKKDLLKVLKEREHG